MELERHIEKLLRAYAKKRRAEAGEALKLHPATRRMLQGEAARRAPKPDAEAEDSLSLWDLFRRRWAVLLGFALVIFFGAALFLPALNPAKQKSQKVLALNQAKERELKTTESLDAATPAAVSPAGAPAEADLKKAKAATTMELADGRQVDALSAQRQPVNKPAPSGAPANLKGTGALTVSGGTGGGFAGGDSGDQANADKVNRAAAATPAAPVVAPAAALTTDSSVATQTFAALRPRAKLEAATAGLNENSQRFLQAPAATAQPPPVLASFEVRQNGNAIAVVDRDGSVYNGTLESGGQAAAQAVTEKLRDQAPAAQNYSFRVTGSNRTLNQEVVFVGKVTGMTNVAVNGAQNISNQLSIPSGGRLQSANANAMPAQRLFFNSRITGTATIDRTNTIEINAEPVAP